MGAIVYGELAVGDTVWVSYDHPSGGARNEQAVVRQGAVRRRYGHRYGFEFLYPLRIPGS